VLQGFLTFLLKYIQQVKILITGASGYIGNKLAHTLAARGNEVHALVRSATGIKLLQHPNIKVFMGDILKKESLLVAMKGCKQVFHTAAKTGVWARDPSVFYQVNVEGTRNVLDIAMQTGVDRMVYTSSCGVLGPTIGEPLTENSLRTTSLRIDYDLSKKIAEDLVIQKSKNGMNNVIVSPSKVYGPGTTSHSNTANAFINKFLKDRIVFIPFPGTYKVCFAYIDDVVHGHLLAMEKGNCGEKYILGGINISYIEFFSRLRSISRQKGVIIQLPKYIILSLAHLQELSHQLTGSPVHFTVKSVNHLFSNYIFSSEKASLELGYRITSLDESLEKTIQFMINKSLV